MSHENPNANENSHSAPYERNSDDASDGWVSVPRGPRGKLLIPPANFGMVEVDLTRSGMPNELNFSFLAQLRLKTIVYLAHEEIPASLDQFIAEQNIRLITLVPDDVEVARQWRPISDEVVYEAFRVLLDTEKYPVHVMCFGGRHRTGTMIGCVRKLQRWFLSSIFEEYQMYATNKGRLVNEQFIELFDTNRVEIPQVPPPWLDSRRNA